MKRVVGNGVGGVESRMRWIWSFLVWGRVGGVEGMCTEGAMAVVGIIDEVRFELKFEGWEKLVK